MRRPGERKTQGGQTKGQQKRRPQHPLEGITTVSPGSSIQPQRSQRENPKASRLHLFPSAVGFSFQKPCVTGLLPGTRGLGTLLVSRSRPASGHWQAAVRRRLGEAAISKDIADWQGRSVKVVSSGTWQEEELALCCRKGDHAMQTSSRERRWQCTPAALHGAGPSAARRRTNWAASGPHRPTSSARTTNGNGHKTSSW